ncbi:MAG: hypothetical protein UIC63_02755 [Bacteroidaceae bacterium]|nr:hypothetical protein [Bacteroidaceae bacterium]
MAKATILSLKQTENTGLFTIIFEGESQSEFVKFISKFRNDAKRQDDLRIILNQIDLMLKSGFVERKFRTEGKIRDSLVALPIFRSGLRLYCLRMSDSVLIVGNGGVKYTKTYEEDKDLNGYVISLQKLDELLKADIKSGVVRIEKTEIIGTENKKYDL